MHALPLRQDDTFYPESDGQPMGETEIHVDEILYLRQAFKRRFIDAADVYVGGNLFLYYRRGDPTAVLCPDVMVVRGVPKKPRRRTFKVWEEGEVPCLVIEVTSVSTRGRDHEIKKTCYASLGVEEYFLYDPLGHALSPQIQGFRLVGSRYQTATLEPDGSLVSHTTGVTLRMEGQEIRLVETATGHPFPRDEELDAALEAAEEEISRLRHQLERRSKEE